MILAINPGSTSTKIAVFKDNKEVFTKTLRHTSQELAPYNSIIEQYDFRKDIILNSVKEEGIEFKTLTAIVGRGGLLKSIPSGVYRTNDLMVQDLKKGERGEHASNLGGILADEIAKAIGEVPSFIIDPVVVDEMQDVARISGHPLMPRISIFHALNQKAVARRYAREIGKKYEDLNLIVAHLGGGISVGAHQKGKVIDVNNALDGEGPFSPERCGTLPVGTLTKICFSGKYQLNDVKQMIKGRGGLAAFFDTTDARVVENRANEGDEQAKLIYSAMSYQVAKEIGANATVLKGKIDAILITGGLAYSKLFVEDLQQRCSFIGEIKVYPGEDEMQALAEGAYYALNGELEIKEYE
ncbi:MAG: butyrate kinase [Bacteriovoracia bacterium]